MPLLTSHTETGRHVVITILAAAFLAVLFGAWVTRPPAADRAPLPERIRAMLAAAPELLPSASEFEHLEAALAAGGADASWRWLKSHYTEADGAVIGKPYFPALRIGDYLYEMRGLDGLADCAAHKAACYHGLIGRAIADRGSPMAEAARAACAETTSVRGEYLSCIHAIGHGLAAAARFDLPAALGSCDEFPDQERRPCWDGVFMEYLFAAPPSAARAEDSWYPCTSVTPEYRFACSRHQAGVMRFKLGLDTPAIASSCLNAPDPALVNPCLDSIGRYAGFASAGDIAVARSICGETGHPHAEERCLSSTAIEIALDFFPDADARAAALCGELSGELRAECSARLERVKRSRYEQDNLY